MKNNLVNLTQFKKQKIIKMIATILIAVTILSIIIWNNLINQSLDNVNIPSSSNITYQNPQAINPNDIIEEIDSNYGKPVLLYIYTTWCGICKKEFPIINEVARKFQNTDLQVISVAIDNNIDERSLINYLEAYPKVYFKPKFLTYSDGLADLLAKKGIRYNRTIPLTAIISREGFSTVQFVGYKSEKYLSRKIIKNLKNNDDKII